MQHAGKQYQEMLKYVYSLRNSKEKGWGGRRKESLQLRLLIMNICIEKVDVKCWLAEMTLVMIFRCFSMFVYILARFPFALIGRNLTAKLMGSHGGIGGRIQIQET